MIDGWSDGSEHFFAIFACTDKQESFLLSFSPPIEAGDLSAVSLQGLIIFFQILGLFNLPNLRLELSSYAITRLIRYPTVKKRQ